MNDSRVFVDTPASRMYDEFALKLFSKNVIYYFIREWMEIEEAITAVFLIVHYPLLAVYTNIKCKELTELATFSLYFLLEVYDDYIYTTQGYE